MYVYLFSTPSVALGQESLTDNAGRVAAKIIIISSAGQMQSVTF